MAVAVGYKVNRMARLRACVKLASLGRALIAIAIALAAASAARAATPVERHVTAGGLDRRYLAYLPDGFQQKGALPVVLAFHGAFGNADGFADLTGLQNARDAANYIIVFAEGHQKTWNVGGGCCGPAGRANVDDLDYVRAVLDDLDWLAKIDRRRIYAAGYSNGGAMSFRLACELSDTIAAISTVGSVMREPQAQCRPARAVPVFEWHGLQDVVSPYNGGATGARAAAPAPPVQETINFWKNVDGVSEAQHVAMFGGAAECDIYSGGRDGAKVQACRLPGLGHRWPGSHPTATTERGDRLVRMYVGDLGPFLPGVDANDTILRFFSGFALPSAPN